MKISEFRNLSAGDLLLFDVSTPEVVLQLKMARAFGAIKNPNVQIPMLVTSIDKNNVGTVFQVHMHAADERISVLAGDGLVRALKVLCKAQ